MRVGAIIIGGYERSGVPGISLGAMLLGAKTILLKILGEK